MSSETQIGFLLLLYFLVPFWTLQNKYLQEGNAVGGSEATGSIAVRKSMPLVLRDKKCFALIQLSWSVCKAQPCSLPGQGGTGWPLPVISHESTTHQALPLMLFCSKT